MTFAPTYTRTDRLGQPNSSRVGRLVEGAVPALRAGRLRLILPSGDIVERCGHDPGPEAVLQAHRWRALWRMLIGGESGFAEGYLDGDWSTPDLGRLLELLLVNEAALGQKAKSSRVSRVRNKLLHRLRANTRRGSRRNIAAHYDLGNDFYRLWLDDGMSYSSALYAGDMSLEAAQDAKLDRIVSLLDLTGGESILEIGCGWGALAERLVRRCGANLFGITLSAEQLGYARTQLAAEIGEGRADLRLLDYREIAGRFDRIASIEMVEAVGERYWPIYFAKLSSCVATGRRRGSPGHYHRGGPLRRLPQAPGFHSALHFPRRHAAHPFDHSRRGRARRPCLDAPRVVRRQLRQNAARMARAFFARMAEDRAARVRRPLPPYVGLLFGVLRSRFPHRRRRCRLF